MLILADFGAGAVLITFGAILGKVNVFQLWVIATIEIFFYCLNEAILMDIFQVVDIGGSMVIHTFGAFFGLSCCVFYSSDRYNTPIKCHGSYLTTLIAFIGTIFLFCYWPSFNAALGYGASMERAAINTYLSIMCSVISSVLIAMLTRGGKLEIDIMVNATLAGGVAVGSAADIIA